MINFLEGKTTISDRKEIEALESELIQMARDTNALEIPSYQPIGRNKLLQGLQSISESVKPLSKRDKAYFLTRDQEKAKFNLEFELSPETIDALFVRDSIESKSQLILRVKKPDYLGDSLRVEMMTQLNYGFDGELISEKFFIEKVMDVLPLPTMEQLKIE